MPSRNRAEKTGEVASFSPNETVPLTNLSDIAHASRYSRYSRYSRFYRWRLKARQTIA
jgi:hypothetical protein